MLDDPFIWIMIILPYESVYKAIAEQFLNQYLMPYTECPKIYRKSVLHLVDLRLLKQMEYKFAVHFGTLSTYIEKWLIRLASPHEISHLGVVWDCIML